MENQETRLLVADGAIESLRGGHAQFHLDRLAELFGRQRSPGDSWVEAVFGGVGRLKDSAPPRRRHDRACTGLVGSRPSGITP